MNLFPAFFLAVLFAMPSALAQDEIETLILRDGQMIRGTVIGTTTFTVTMKVESTEITYHASECDIHSLYNIRSRDLGDDVAGAVELAGLLAEHDYFSLACVELERAIMLDPTLKESQAPLMVAITEGLAEDVLDAAKKKIEVQEYARARRYLSSILTRFPDTSAAEQARSLLPKVQESMDTQMAAAELEVHRKAAAEQMARQDPEVTKVRTEEEIIEQYRQHAEPIKKRVEKARKLNHDALAKGGSTSGFEQAISQFQKVLADADKLAEKFSDDEGLLAVIEEKRPIVQSELIEAMLNLGSVYLVRESHTQALELANQALAVDPKNHDAQSFRARVEAAASDDRWSRTRFGRRGR